MKYASFERIVELVREAGVTLKPVEVRWLRGWCTQRVLRVPEEREATDLEHFLAKWFADWLSGQLNQGHPEPTQHGDSWDAPAPALSLHTDRIQRLQAEITTIAARLDQLNLRQRRLLLGPPLPEATPPQERARLQREQFIEVFTALPQILAMQEMLHHRLQQKLVALAEAQARQQFPYRRGG